MEERSHRSIQSSSENLSDPGTTVSASPVISLMRANEYVWDIERSYGEV